ncbi:integrase-like protein [Caballeronia temeraria]|uniref:Integrase-like protein n=1 Tax=Caballeronia temeraria TaxID=1777137 RepID=A0A158AXC1_9BURK|nr:tyrosine-type recombinase/integrase [Caballeronia temeraria]SAK62462.1 integrase-like protein [Caballeronia temeraria]
MAARRRKAARRAWPANLYQNAAGYFWFRNPDDGRTIGLGRDFKLATAQVRTANAELLRRRGDISLLQKIDGAGISFAEWCLEYERENLPQNRHSAVGMRSQLKGIRASAFASQAIAAVRPREVADFLRDVQEQRGSYAAIAYRSRLADVFRQAIERGFVDSGRSPVDAVFKPRTAGVTRSRLTLDEYKQLIAKAREEPRHRWIANAIELALVCGQRREDIAKMRFDQIHDGFLWVEQSKGKEGHRSKLRIPLDLRLDVLGVTLGDVLKRCRDTVVSKYVIHFIATSGGSRPGDACKPATLSTRFAAMRDAAGLVAPDGKTPVTFHELRSLAARLYTEQHGADFAQALLGHKSPEMTALYRDSRGREWTEVKVKVG